MKLFGQTIWEKLPEVIRYNLQEVTIGGVFISHEWFYLCVEVSRH